MQPHFLNVDVCKSDRFVSVGNMIEFGGIGRTVMSKSNSSLACDVLFYISTPACKSAIMYLVKNDSYVQTPDMTFDPQ